MWRVHFFTFVLLWHAFCHATNKRIWRWWWWWLGLLNRNTGCQCCAVRCSSMLKLLCIWIHIPNFSLDFQNFEFFNGQNGQAGGTASLCQILSKSLQPRPRYSELTAALLFRNLGFYCSSFLLGALLGNRHSSASFFRVKPRHVERFRKCRLADVRKVSWDKRTEASKFTKMGTWGG